MKGADFRDAKLMCTSFRKTTKYDLARWRNTILDNIAVRELLCDKSGDQTIFKNCNFEAANLDGLRLNNFDFRGANFTNASMIDTHLEGTNLAHTQSVGTNFTKAHLTGACIEAWNIDSTTVLEGVDCDYVFLLEYPNSKTGSRERRPHNSDKNFESGDFQKLYTQIMHTVQFLFRYGEDSQAFASSFKSLAEQYPELELRSVEKFDDDYLFTAAVSASTNKEDLAVRFEKMFRAKCIENQKIRATLSSAIDGLDQSMGIIRLLLNEPRIQSTTYTISAPDGGTAIMTNFTNTNITTGDGSIFNTGSIEQFGNTISFGEVSGNVLNAIDQLPKEKAELKPLLAQLHKEIETSDISDEDKVMAFEELNKLSQIARNPSTPEASRKARKILTLMRGLLPTAAEIATIVSAISQFFM